MWARKHGVDIDALLRISHGRQNYETIRLIAPHLETPEEIDFLVRTEEDCHEGIGEVRGARALLDAMGTFAPWAVVTSAWRSLAEKRLRLAGLPIPDVLITSDDISHSKPHPEGYLLAAKRLGIAPGRLPRHRRRARRHRRRARRGHACHRHYHHVRARAAWLRVVHRRPPRTDADRVRFMKP
jgi:beta-phosphoglucomutase-like phosphatase (HAD superfamily)